MPDFQDGFARPDTKSGLGNGWRYVNRLDQSGVAAPKPWHIEDNRALSSDANGVQTIAYRRKAVSGATPYAVAWHFRGAGFAEACFRMQTATGYGRARLAIVIVNGVGSLRYRRDGGTVAGAQHRDQVIGQWNRINDADFVLKAVVVGNAITIYDSNFTGPDNKALQATVAEYSRNPDIGVARGPLDSLVIDDVLASDPTDLVFAPVRTRAVASLDLRTADPSEVDEVIAQRVVGIEVEPYVVREGIPQDLPVGLRMGFESAIYGEAVGSELLLPATGVDTKADLRWLAEAAHFRTTAKPNEWSPSVGNPGTGVLALVDSPSLRKDRQTRPSLPHDPVLSPAYQYSTVFGRLGRAAVSLNGRGYLQLVQPLPPRPTAAPTDPSFTDAVQTVNGLDHGGPSYATGAQVAAGRRLESIYVQVGTQSIFYLPKGHPAWPRGGWFSPTYPDAPQNELNGYRFTWVNHSHYTTRALPVYHRRRNVADTLLPGELRIDSIGGATTAQAKVGTRTSPGPVFARRRVGANTPPPPDTTTGRCYAFVAVLHPGLGPDYGLLHTDRSQRPEDSGAPLQLTYAKGSFLVSGDGRILTHHAVVSPSAATVVILNCDDGADRGTLLVQGRSRLNKSFSLGGIDAFSDGFFVGGRMNYPDEFSEYVAADMDLFEFNLYRRALLPAERLQLLSKLCTVYGIAQ